MRLPFMFPMACLDIKLREVRPRRVVVFCVRSPSMRRLAQSALALTAAIVVGGLTGAVAPLATPAEATELVFDFGIGWDEPPRPRRFRRPLPHLSQPDVEEFDETELYAQLPPPGHRFRRPHRRDRSIVVLPDRSEDWDDGTDDGSDDTELSYADPQALPYGGYPDTEDDEPIIVDRLPPAIVRPLPRIVRPAPLRRPLIKAPAKLAKVKPLPAPKPAIASKAPLPKVAVLKPYVEPPAPKPQQPFAQPAPVAKAPSALPPMAKAPDEPRTVGSRSCPKGTEIERRLSADGWSGFANPEKRTRSVLMTAKRDGVSYRLTLDRCTGVVLSAKLLNGKQAAN
jgi:hypothetical protein